MAEKIVIPIEVRAKKAQKEIDDLGDSLDKTKDKAEDSEKGFGSLSGMLKGGLGIGMVMSALDALGGALMENQKVQDLMNKATVVFQGAINGVIEVLEPLFDWLEKVFNDPVKSMKEFGEMFKKNIETRLEGALEMIPQLGKAISLLFKGEFAEAGKVAANAWGKVMFGVEDTVGLVKKGIEVIGDASKKVAKSTQKAFDNKEALANAENNLARLSILYQGIVEKYDLMAEKQRQIRDDETKTIEERIKANEELAKVLDEGAKKEKANIQARIGIIQMQNNLLGKTKERTNEILSLQQELTGIDAKYAGLKSEQLTNINSLEKEGIELKRAEVEGTLEANKIIMEANAERMAGDLEGFEYRKKLMDEEYKNQTKLLEDQISQLKEGTQAYVDATNEKKILDAQYYADSISLEDEKITFMGEAAEMELEILRDAAEKKKELQQEVLTNLKQITDLSNKFLDNSNEKIDKDYENRIERLKELGYTEEQISEMKDAELAKIDARARKNFEIAKNLRYAETLLSTIEGTQNAFTSAQKSPITGIFPAYPFIQAAASALFGVAQLQQISQSSFESKLKPSTGGSTPSEPNVGIISGQMNSSAQLLGSLNNSLSSPQRAYVVGQDVNSQQSLDRHIRQNATL